MSVEQELSRMTKMHIGGQWNLDDLVKITSNSDWYGEQFADGQVRGGVRRVIIEGQVEYVRFGDVVSRLLLLKNCLLWRVNVLESGCGARKVELYEPVVIGQTETLVKMCLAENGLMLQFVEKPNLRMCRVALAQNAGALKYC